MGPCLPYISLSTPDFQGCKASLRNLDTLGKQSSRASELLEDALYKAVQMRGVAVASGTAALLLALRIVGVGRDDLVVAPTFTFVATCNPILQLGAVPVLVDCVEDGLGMDPDLLEEALSECAANARLPKAVVVAHLYGEMADAGKLSAVCARYNVPLIEDVAESLGVRMEGRLAGGWGDASVLSFNANKIVTGLGGGVLVSEKTWIRDRAAFLSCQAREKSRYGDYIHKEYGYNFRMPAPVAWLAAKQLDLLESRVVCRRRIWRRYCNEFEVRSCIQPVSSLPGSESTHWLSVFRIDWRAAGVSRSRFIEQLGSKGIETRPVWRPMHKQPLFGGVRVYGGATAESLYRSGICLPSSSHLSRGDQDRVVSEVLSLVKSE